MTNKIITISRQFGSGGRTVGKLVAEKLGIPCYDSQIISEIAKKSGFAEEYIKENGEYMESSGFFASLGNVGYYGQSNQLTIWSEQCRIIKELAEKGNCVIVGRCADYVLKDADVSLLKTFIYACTAAIPSISWPSPTIPSISNTRAKKGLCCRTASPRRTPCRSAYLLTQASNPISFTNPAPGRSPLPL